MNALRSILRASDDFKLGALFGLSVAVVVAFLLWGRPADAVRDVLATLDGLRGRVYMGSPAVPALALHAERPSPVQQP